MSADFDAATTERELSAAIHEILTLAVEGPHFAVEGPQLGGAIQANVDSFGYTEDNQTLIVMVEFADHRLGCFQFSPGLPVTSSVIAEADFNNQGATR